MEKKKEPNEQPVIKEQKATYDDYAKLDDGLRYELVDGVLELMSPAPTPKHQDICLNLYSALRNTCQSDYIILASPIDLILSRTEVRQPDIIMIDRSKIAIITQRGIEGIPDLVAEILSPHSIRRDRQSKLRTYAKYGIPEYWIVDPANLALEQFLLASDGKYELLSICEYEDCVQSDRLPCVSFMVRDILDSAAMLPG